MNRRELFSALTCALFLWAARAFAQVRIPSRARGSSPFRTGNYMVQGWRTEYAILVSQSEVRYLAVKVSPEQTAAAPAISVYDALYESGAVEDANEDFQPVETRSNGKIVWILTLGEMEKLRIRAGLNYRLESWFARPPAVSVDSYRLSGPSPILISFGRETSAGKLV